MSRLGLPPVGARVRLTGLHGYAGEEAVVIGWRPHPYRPDWFVCALVEINTAVRCWVHQSSDWRLVSPPGRKSAALQADLFDGAADG